MKIKLFCIVIAYCFSFHNIFAQEKAFVALSSTKKVGNNLYIYYLLSGTYKQRYNISLSLKRHLDKDYIYVPVNLYGDVGDNITAGSKSIIWEIDKEFPQGLDMVDYYFVVKEKSGIPEPQISDNVPEPEKTANEPNQKTIKSGSSPLLWIGAATVAIGGGVAGYLLLNKKKEPNIPTILDVVPPDRP